MADCLSSVGLLLITELMIILFKPFHNFVFVCALMVMHWIDLAHDRDRWWAVVNAVLAGGAGGG